MKAFRQVCISIAALVALGGTSSAQAPMSQTKQKALDRCYANPSQYQRYCEVRDFIVPARGALTIDGGKQGDVTVHGSDAREVHVLATVKAEARTGTDARDVARTVQVRAGGTLLEATADWSEEVWSVSFEVWVPRDLPVTVTSDSGSVVVDGVKGWKHK